MYYDTIVMLHFFQKPTLSGRGQIAYCICNSSTNRLANPRFLARECVQMIIALSSFFTQKQGNKYQDLSQNTVSILAHLLYILSVSHTHNPYMFPFLYASNIVLLLCKNPLLSLVSSSNKIQKITFIRPFRY